MNEENQKPDFTSGELLALQVGCILLKNETQRNIKLIMKAIEEGTRVTPESLAVLRTLLSNAQDRFSDLSF
jgi:hypothetical protein